MSKNTMKGATLPGNSTVAFAEYQIPKPGHGQVLVKTKCTTICGSDIAAST
jgi:D-arabinose 1-dehydrogenase-like Zn-dependent alcohol dehydrogenase